MHNSFTQKFYYNAGGNVKMVKLQVEYRNKGMKGGWTTRSILKNNPVEDDDWLDVLSNLYAGQEATVRNGQRTTDWFQIGKGVCQGCILSPCLFNLYAEYIIHNARLDEAQAGIKIAGRNINNLNYADDNTVMAVSKEELNSHLMKVK